MIDVKGIIGGMEEIDIDFYSTAMQGLGWWGKSDHKKFGGSSR